MVTERVSSPGGDRINNKEKNKMAMTGTAQESGTMGNWINEAEEKCAGPLQWFRKLEGEKIWEMKQKAKENVCRQIGTLTLVLVIEGLLIYAFSHIPLIGALAVMGPVSVGTAYVFWKNGNGETADLNDLFNVVKDTQCLKASVISGILTTLFSALWGLLLIVPGGMKHYSYAMTSYIIMRQPETDAKKAMEQSVALMDGHRMDLLKLDFSFFGWVLAGLFTFGIPLIYAVPLHRAARNCFFTELFEKVGNKGASVILLG